MRFLKNTIIVKELQVKSHLNFKVEAPGPVTANQAHIWDSSSVHPEDHALKCSQNLPIFYILNNNESILFLFAIYFIVKSYQNICLQSIPMFFFVFFFNKKNFSALNKIY